MTRQLKELMDEATDRPAFTPDVDRLVATGRRQVRKRRLLTSIATAAAVALLAGGITVALTTTNQSAPAPAVNGPKPVAPVSFCETDKVAAPRPPSSTDPTRWSEVVLVTDDADGTTSVRLSPATGQIAYCTTWLGIEGSTRKPRPTGYWTIPLGRINMVHKFEATGCGSAARKDCDGISIGFAGRLPKRVTRVTLVGNGQTVDAVLSNGFYVGRYFAPRSSGQYVPIMVKMYVASGKLLVQATG
ncbi:hypothetical protein GCM10009554_45880 [Kribbella koreensis]|uniref:Uncharacterized protein n=1 Tax=Kribbella koreensis TaxID=57909 RepID=A0ABN1QW60_9ACTN